MRSDNDVLEFIQNSTLSVHISEDKKQEILSNINHTVQSERTPRGRHDRLGWIGGSLAGAAALLVIVSGFLLEYHKSLPQYVKQGVTTATHHPANSSGTTSYRVPSIVSSIQLGSADSVMEMPRDLSAQTKLVYGWLQTAEPTKITVPKNATMFPMFPPTQLYFVDQSGQKVDIEPVYYSLPNGLNGSIEPPAWTGPAPRATARSRTVVQLKNVLAYRRGHQISYFKSPALYSWLKGNSWEKTFQPETWDIADTKAIRAVMKSPDGVIFKGLFPVHPGIAACEIPHGGPAPVNGASATLPGTCQTQTQANESNTKVIMTETWYNSKDYFKWSYIVNSNGVIISKSYSQSGDSAPQFWQ